MSLRSSIACAVLAAFVFCGPVGISSRRRLTSNCAAKPNPARKKRPSRARPRPRCTESRALRRSHRASLACLCDLAGSQPPLQPCSGLSTIGPAREGHRFLCGLPSLHRWQAALPSYHRAGSGRDREPDFLRDPTPEGIAPASPSRQSRSEPRASANTGRRPG